MTRPSKQVVAEIETSASSESLSQVDPELLSRLWNPLLNENYLTFQAYEQEILEGSYIEYYLNGLPLGKAFQNIYFAKYHPAISLYNSAQVTCNFGPDLKFLPEGFQAYCDAKLIPLWAPLLQAIKSAKSERLANEKRKKRQERLDAREDRRNSVDIPPLNPSSVVN